jgi:hypothetical protein
MKFEPAIDFADIMGGKQRQAIGAVPRRATTGRPDRGWTRLDPQPTRVQQLDLRWLIGQQLREGRGRQIALHPGSDLLDPRFAG